jgi:hypothetical protein
VQTVYSCEVHGERMNSGYVSILPQSPESQINTKSYLQSKQLFFPNSNFFLVDRNKSVTEGHAKVYFCSKCRDTEREWNRANSQGQRLIAIPQP